MNILSQLISQITNADSYKVSHWSQYPKGTTHVSSYIEARKSSFAKAFGPEYDYAVFFGLQPFLKDYLSVPVTQEDIDLAEILYELHGEPFNKAGWQHILDQYGGKLPVEIRALPEGTVAKTGNALVEIVNTDPECFWLTSYVETAMLRSAWYATTVATKSRIAKDTIGKYLNETCDNPEGLVDFMFNAEPFANPVNLALHDFGARGASSMETASLGGMAHLLNFKGTDTVTGILAAIRYYDPNFEKALAANDNPKKAMITVLKKMKEDGVMLHGISVEASEHSTMTIKGRDGEESQIKMMIDKAREGKISSIVSDSYDLWNALDLYGGKYKGDIIEAGQAGGRIVVRPDSGEPEQVVVEVLKRLEANFGCTVNSKGYKVLPPYLRVLQGDAMHITAGKDPVNMFDKVLSAMKAAGYSAENVVFGMGGGLLQEVGRDDLSFAMKASAAKINGVWGEVYKDPITAEVFQKKSKRGRLSTIWDGTAFETIQTTLLGASRKDAMEVVFRNGEIIKATDFETARRNVNYFTHLTYHKPVIPVQDPWAQALTFTA